VRRTAGTGHAASGRGVVQDGARGEAAAEAQDEGADAGGAQGVDRGHGLGGGGGRVRRAVGLAVGGEQDVAPGRVHRERVVVGQRGLEAGRRWGVAVGRAGHEVLRDLGGLPEIDRHPDRGRRRDRAVVVGRELGQAEADVVLALPDHGVDRVAHDVPLRREVRRKRRDRAGHGTRPIHDDQ
jgi:hypothetical protein